MTPPFTSDQFLDVFRVYNEAVWPAQAVLLGVGVAAAVLAYAARWRQSPKLARLAIVLLSLLWLWSGIVFHKMFFATVTPAGQIFGSLFVAEGGLLLIVAWLSGDLPLPSSRSSVVAGSLLLAYAFVLYPAIGLALAHRYPILPTFGVPCPTAIFTFAIVCLMPGAFPRFAMAIPLLWTVIASWGAVSFGMREDSGLLVAAITAMLVVHHETHRPPEAGHAVM